MLQPGGVYLPARRSKHAPPRHFCEGGFTMKKLLFLALLAAALVGLLATPALASAKTIVLSPSPTGNDTGALLAAFAAAGPGGTVQLTAGHFTINDMLVTGFQGTFRGAGQGKTVIGCPDGGVSLVNGMDFTYLLGFQGGAVTVSDMSFKINSTAPAEPWDWGDASNLTFIEAVLYLNGQSSAAVNRVSFTGYAKDPVNGWSGWNADQSVIVQGVGACTMGGCTCATAEGFWGQYCTNARVTVGGGQGNVFDSVGAACGFYDYGNSQLTVCGNRFVCGGTNGISTQGVVVYQDPGTSISHYLFSGNTMRVLTGGSAIGLIDGDGSSGPRAIDATIVGNDLNLGTADTAADVGGIGELWTQNIRCLGNALRGYAIWGFGVGDDQLDDSYFPVSGWLIVGNDCHKLTAGMADVFLGHGTSYCLVVGGPPPTTVLDYGTGNTLINVTKLPLPVSAQAATPRNSLKQLKSLKEMMKRF
jgi:hypothetical protein